MRTIFSTSCIICTKDRPDDLKACIKSIEKQTIKPNEIIIVDAGKIKGLESQIIEITKNSGIKLIYLYTKPGLPSQRNLGVKHASGEIIFFFDDDVILDENYIEEILKVYKLKQNENIGGVQGTIKNLKPSPFLKYIFERLFMIGCRVKEGKAGLLPSGFPLIVCNPSDIVETEIQLGCCASFKREIFNRFQFDEKLEKLSNYALKEDLDFSYRVSRYYKMFQTPYATLFHRESPVSRINLARYSELRVLNNYYFFKKSIPQTVFNKICYILANIGLIIGSLNNPYRLCGILEGISKLMKNKTD